MKVLLTDIKKYADHVYDHDQSSEIHFEKNGFRIKINEPVHEISNNVVCAPIKASDQPAQMHSLIRAFASRLSIL